MSATGNEPHLTNAARALEAILRNRWPDHVWMVRVKEEEQDDTGPSALGEEAR